MMKRIVRFLFFVFCVFTAKNPLHAQSIQTNGPLAGIRASAEAPVLVFEHANLIDGISDAPQRDVTVVVAGGKISVVSATRISPPANAKRFDLSGQWLLPGFIDAHIHPVSIGWAKSLLANGMTTGRSMFTVRYVDVELRERHRRGEFDIPDILAAGYPVVPNIGTFPIPYDMAAIFEDNPQLKDLRGDVNIGVAGAQRLVRANLDRHVDVIKVFATNRAGILGFDPRGRALSDEQLVAAVSEARNAGIPVAVHAYGDDGVVAAVRAGVRSIEHGVYLTDATLELMKEKNVFFVPTISAFPLHGHAESNASGADSLAARGQDMAVSVRDAARRAHKMGLRVIAGTDGASIGGEITELVGIGMTPMEAIQAATSRCAEALGISKRTGSIRPGLEADLIVLNGNPLEDINAVRNVALVVNDGRIVEKAWPEWVLNAVLILIAVAAVGALVCFIWVVIRLLRARGIWWALVGFLFGPYAFIWGWLEARRRKHRRLMIVWTVCTTLFLGAVILLYVQYL